MARLSGTILHPIKLYGGKSDPRYIVHDCFCGHAEPRWCGLFLGHKVTPFLETPEAAISEIIAWHDQRQAAMKAL